MQIISIRFLQGLDKAIQVQLENRADGGDGAGDAAAIVVIKCPKCATPIRRSRRYIKLLNERAMQIEAVKKKLLGDKTKEQLLAEWATLKVALTETAASFQGTILQLERQQQVAAATNRCLSPQLYAIYLYFRALLPHLRRFTKQCKMFSTTRSPANGW
jgi:hypothetical protein